MDEVWQWYSNRMIQYLLLTGAKWREGFLKELPLCPHCASYELKVEIKKDDSKNFLCKRCGKNSQLRGLYIRPMNFYSMQGIEYNISSCGFNEKPFHFYATVARVDWLSFKNPPQDKKLWKEFRKEFNAAFDSLVRGYDIVLDIDNDDLMEAHKVAEKVKQVFDQYQLPYYIIFSGSKGFHFRIDWDDWGEVAKEISTDPKAWPLITKQIAQNIAKTCGFSFGSQADLDSIYDLRRVIRVPYSIHPKTQFVALPLDDKQFKEFVPVAFSISKTLANVKLMNRGLLKRNFPAKPGVVKKFVTDFAPTPLKISKA